MRKNEYSERSCRFMKMSLPLWFCVWVVLAFYWGNKLVCVNRKRNSSSRIWTVSNGLKIWTVDMIDRAKSFKVSEEASLGQELNEMDLPVTFNLWSFKPFCANGNIPKSWFLRYIGVRMDLKTSSLIFILFTASDIDAVFNFGNHFLHG